MKKLAIFLASIFLLSVCTANAALLSPMDFASSSSFTDVNSGTSYTDSIDWMKNNDIASGYEDGSFGVDKCVKRMEFLKMMYKVQDREIPTDSSTSALFKDTPANAWYIPYLKIAKQEGIVTGYSDGTFRPSQCISRAAAAKLATLSFNNNVMPKNAASDYYWSSASNYGDIKKGDWSYQYLDYALKANAIGTDHTWSSYDYTTGSNKFQPNDSMTRKEAAELFFRFKSMKDNQTTEYAYGQKPVIKEEKKFYNNCTNDLSLPEGLDIGIDADILSALPKDSSIVVGADHSNDSQLKNIDKILSTLTKQDFWKEASTELAQFDMLIEGEWEAAVGVSMDSPSDSNPDVVVVGKFAQDAEFENFIKDFAADEMNYSLTCKKSGGITYWTSSKSEFYFAKFDKFFILSNTEQGRKNAITRIGANNGFSFSNNLNSGKLAYLYIDKDFIGTIKAELQNEMEPFLSQMVGTLDSIGDIYGYIKSDNEGFLSSLEAKVTNSNDPFIKNYIGTSPSLVSKVPGKNTLLYAEDIDLSLVVEAMSSSSYSTYDDTLTEISTELGATNTEIDNLLSSPYAFSMAYNESFVPSISFYLQLESGDRATADKIVTAIDKAVDEGIPTNEVTVTKSTTSSGLKKVTLDVNSMPTSSAEEIATKNSLKKSGVEFYYGILADNTFVVALYPNFEQAYGSTSLSQDSTFSQAVKKLNGVYGGKLSYVNITNLTEYITNIMFLFGDSSLMMPSEKEMATIKELVGIFKYFISSTEVTKTSLAISSYLRMGN